MIFVTFLFLSFHLFIIAFPTPILWAATDKDEADLFASYLLDVFTPHDPDRNRTDQTGTFDHTPPAFHSPKSTAGNHQAQNT